MPRRRSMPLRLAPPTATPVPHRGAILVPHRGATPLHRRAAAPLPRCAAAPPLSPDASPLSPSSPAIPSPPLFPKRGSLPSSAMRGCACSTVQVTPVDAPTACRGILLLLPMSHLAFSSVDKFADERGLRIPADANLLACHPRPSHLLHHGAPLPILAMGKHKRHPCRCVASSSTGLREVYHSSTPCSSAYRRHLRCNGSCRFYSTLLTLRVLISTTYTILVPISACRRQVAVLISTTYTILVPISTILNAKSSIHIVLMSRTDKDAIYNSELIVESY
ncbi:uncharacterized protein LOC119300478 [Triticum dicoccoides]|uniref:uncharacterized protein LOC119300478 n=1 Tax=Triticum dicoccoides TaxID=85692 RepID=UPI00188F7A3B|nr:uncharacterized protein LOC119300478 [Triticum dicoccoides]